MLTRLRTDARGFGLVELIMAMTVLNIALLALVASLNSSALALDRASKKSTAASLADAQMELYRALTYAEIRLDAVALTAADVDAVYTNEPYDDPVAGCDTTVLGTYCTDPVVRDTDTVTAAGPPVGCADHPSAPRECDPVREEKGPDGRTFRIDTYVTLAESPGAAVARPLKVVTVVVRDPEDLDRVLARQQSTFDLSTGY